MVSHSNVHLHINIFIKGNKLKHGINSNTWVLQCQVIQCILAIWSEFDAYL